MMHNKWFANFGVVGHAQYTLVKLNTCIPLVGIGYEMYMYCIFSLHNLEFPMLSLVDTNERL